MSSRLPRARLVAAQDRAELAPLAALTLLVLVTSFLLAAVPRQLAAAEGEALQEALSRATPAARELSASATNTAPARQLAAIDRQLREDQRPGLARRVSEPVLTATSDPFDVLTLDGEVLRPQPFSWLLLQHQRGLLDGVRWVEGEAPDGRGPTTARTRDGEAVPVLETGIVRQLADVLDVEVGRTYLVRPRTPQPGGVGVFAVRVSGSFDRTDPEDPRWSYLTQVWSKGERYTADGTLLAEVGAVLVDESQLERLRRAVGTLRYDWHYPVDTEGLAPAEVPALLAAVRASVSNAASATIPLEQETYREPSVSMGSGLVDLLVTHQAAARATSSVVAVAVAGLAVLALLVLTLASLVVVVRRSPVLDLARARGASITQVVLVVVSGVAVGVLPAAVAGGVLARALVGGSAGSVGTADLALAASVGAWALASCAVAAWWQARTHRRGTAVRRVVEGGLVVLALAGVLVLRTRGPGEDGGSVDPLLAGTPVLVALALAAVLLRLSPVLVDRLAATRQASRGLVSFLGLARAARRPAVLAAPLATLLVSLCFAVFATGAVRSVDAAQLSGTWREVGADYRVEATFIPPEILAATQELEGVQDVATAYVRTAAGVEDERGRSTAAIAVVLDAPAYARLLEDAPDGTLGSADPAAVRDLGRRPGGEGDPLPVLVTADADAAMGGDVDLGGGLGTTPVTRRTVTERFPLAGDRPLVVADLAAVQARESAPIRPNTLLVTGAPGLADELEEVVARADQPHLVVDRRAALAEVQSSPFVGSTRQTFAVAVPVAGGYALLATVLALVLAAPTRRRDAAVLRRLGATSRESLRLALTEQAPVVLGMLAGGVVAGLGLVWLALDAVDLSPLTGGTGPPEVHLPYLATTWLTGGLLVLVAAATVLVSVAERRPDPGRDDGSER